jgi:hypothetical protein
MVYLDDIVIFSQTFGEHIARLSRVLQRIKELKPEKWQLFKDEVAFLGHRVSKDGVLPDNHNVEKILNWSTPTNVTEVRQFLGTASYYKRFIKGFSTIAKPLTELTQKGHPFHWTKSCKAAFQQLKAILTGSEIMGYPDTSRGSFILDTDA